MATAFSEHSELGVVFNPFSALLQSIINKSHLARYDRLKQDNKKTRNEKDEELIIGDLHILTKGWKVYVRGKECKFANREFELLVFLASNPNIVFSKETLFERI